MSYLITRYKTVLMVYSNLLHKPDKTFHYASVRFQVSGKKAKITPVVKVVSDTRDPDIVMLPILS